MEEILLNMHAYLCYCKVCETNFTKKASALAIPILFILVVRWQKVSGLQIKFSFL